MEQLIDFSQFKNVKITEKIANYLKRESTFDISDNIVEKKESNKKLKLNFEFSFFKLSKLLFTDDSLITNKNDFNSILKYCLNKSIQQYNLFQIQNLPLNTDYFDDFDENDEFNIVEL